MDACLPFEGPSGLRLAIRGGDAGVNAVEFVSTPASGDSHPVLEEAVRQLEAYFAGRLWRFDLPLDFRGTAFRRKVWVKPPGT